MSIPSSYFMLSVQHNRKLKLALPLRSKQTNKYKCKNSNNVNIGGRKFEMASEPIAEVPVVSTVPIETFGYLEEPREGWMLQESFRDKFVRKTKENPLVPMGLAVTIGALTYGLYQMKTGNRRMSQKMMRLRVFAQGFTVFALLGGVLYQSNTKKTEKKAVNS